MAARRDRRSTLLLVLGTVATNCLLVCIWLWWAFGTNNGFADLTVDALKDPAVRAVAARQIVTALENEALTSQVAMAAGPVLEPVVAELVGTSPFRGLVYAGARQLHETLQLGNSSRMLVAVDDAGPMVKDALRLANPDVARAVPDGALDIAVGISQNTRLDAAIHFASLTGWLLWPLLAVTLLASGAAVAIARDRRDAVLRLGLALSATGALWSVALVATVAAVSRSVDGAVDRAAVRAVFRAFTHVLVLTARTALVAGIMITLAALVAGQELVQSQLRAFATRVRRQWARPVLHGVLGGAIVLLGALVSVYPDVVLALVARGAGLALTFVGLVAAADALGASAWVAASSGTPRATIRRVALVGSALVAAIVLLLSLSGFTLYRSVQAARAVAPDVRRGCNGHVELCDRRLDQVVLAGTHNSMAASAERGWFLARQSGGIGAQLSRGVRAFLIDAHYGTRIGTTVRTDLGSEAEATEGYDELSTDERAVLNRLLGLLGAAKTPDESKQVYLCHVACELGATRADAAFAKIDAYLAENPNEVVVLVVEDHVAPADVDAALRSSGLADRVHALSPDRPLPTLREMIEGRHNVVVMAENAGTGPSYQAAYDRLLQDTPYRFATTDDFTCAAGRGRPENPLLLLNHWLWMPQRIDIAGQVNARQVLLDRVAQCRAARGRLPNIVAVDYYASGALFDVVDELNGVDRPAPAG